jgi:5'-phosphate synthase pdxT subunit
VKIGVLALQGDFREHLNALRSLGAVAVPVRTREDIEGVDAIVLPGGESTTIGFMLAEHDLVDPLRKRLQEGLPAYGTCAGMILLAAHVAGGDVPKLAVLDAVVHRNAYGRQVDSFEDDVVVRDVGTVKAVFIRAPIVESVGEDVDVLGMQNERPVVVRQGRILASTFHPELTEDASMHRYFLDSVCG